MTIGLGSTAETLRSKASQSAHGLPKAAYESPSLPASLSLCAPLSPPPL